jgi:hypothetical protein
MKDRAPDPDKILNKILKQVVDVTLALLMRIFQACMN